jgi:hypothetical protein
MMKIVSKPGIEGEGMYENPIVSTLNVEDWMLSL